MFTLFPLLGAATFIARGRGAVAACVIFVCWLMAAIVLPQMASRWDCANGTHPGERPCEIGNER
jgi:hypothetical protein